MCIHVYTYMYIYIYMDIHTKIEQLDTKWHFQVCMFHPLHVVTCIMLK